MQLLLTTVAVFHSDSLHPLLERGGRVITKNWTFLPTKKELTFMLTPFLFLVVRKSCSKVKLFFLSFLYLQKQSTTRYHQVVSDPIKQILFIKVIAGHQMHGLVEDDTKSGLVNEKWSSGNNDWRCKCTTFSRLTRKNRWQIGLLKIYTTTYY